jgi:hypothetical protein
LRIGLKQKLSLSYFRENLFLFFAKKSIQKYTKITKNFAKIDAKIFAQTKIEANIFAKTKFGCNHILNSLFHNFLAEIFVKIFAKTEIFANSSPKTKSSRKRKFRENHPIFAWLSLLAKMKKPFLFQPYLRMGFLAFKRPYHEKPFFTCRLC